MKKLAAFLSVIGLACLMTSCMEEMENGREVQGGQVAFIISDFKPEPETKSAFTVSDSELKFQWSARDTLGIFPLSGFQASFPMESGAGSNVAVFDGGSWGLKREDTYYAYYPFNKENFRFEDMKEKVKYTYHGQEACFADDNGLVDLSRYDYMASGKSSVENGSVSFMFRHLGALCRIILTVPETASYSYFVLESGAAVFPISGKFDATDKSGEGISLVAGSDKESQFKVLLPEGHQDFAAGDNIEMYFLMPPVNLTGNTLEFKLFDSNANEHACKLDPKNIVAGMTYGWNVGEFSEPEPAVAEIVNVRAAASIVKFDVKMNKNVKYVFYDIYSLADANRYMKEATEEEKNRIRADLLDGGWAAVNANFSWNTDTGTATGEAYTKEDEDWDSLNPESDYAILYITRDGSNNISGLQMSPSFTTKRLVRDQPSDYDPKFKFGFADPTETSFRFECEFDSETVARYYFQYYTPVPDGAEGGYEGWEYPDEASDRDTWMYWMFDRYDGYGGWPNAWSTVGLDGQDSFTFNYMVPGTTYKFACVYETWDGYVSEVLFEEVTTLASQEQ